MCDDQVVHLNWSTSVMLSLSAFYPLVMGGWISMDDGCGMCISISSTGYQTYTITRLNQADRAEQIGYKGLTFIKPGFFMQRRYMVSRLFSLIHSIQ